MAAREGILIVKDFDASPVANFVVDFPAGYHYASVTCVNVGCSTSRNMRIRPSVGGVPATLSVRKFALNHTASTVVLNTSPAGANLLDSGTSGMYGTARIFNMNVPAPVMIYYRHFHDTPEHDHNVFLSTVSYNQVYFDTNSGGTYNTGKVYIQLYKRDAVLEVTDFGASSNANVLVENLDPATDGLITIVSYDMESSSSCQIRYQESVNGTTFDAGTNHYKRGGLTSGWGGVTFETKMMVANVTGTVHGLAVIIQGAPSPSKTLIQANVNTIDSVEATMYIGYRDADQACLAVRLQATLGAFDGGKAYVTRYAL